MFQVLIEDAYDHSNLVDEFETLEEARKCYDKCLSDGPEEFELSVELEEIIEEGNDYKSIAYHEWFTQEEWEEARG